MDIHRCRFVPYRPQSINSLAFSHRSNLKQKPPSDLRLALGRENGDVEIWNPLAGRWVQERILRGSQGRTIEQVAWTQDLLVDEENTGNTFDDGPLRLFTSGGSPSITEWDLATGLQKRHAEGNTGDIWCFAAQPQWKRIGKEPELAKIAAQPSQLLAAGCSNGSVILFSTADDSLQYLRVLAAATTKKAKVISITWRDRNTVVAGYEDARIQVIDVSSRTVVRAMTLGKSNDGTPSVVWTVKCLSDGTILSGDSSGELKIWDARTLALTQRLKAHDADILDIAADARGDTIFTAGVDRRVVVFKQLSASAGSKKARWQRVAHRRYHQHDVKSLASFEAQGLSVVASGGIDTVPIIMPLRNWDTEYHLTLSHLPQKPQMSCSSRARLMLTWWDRDLFIWNLPQPLTAETNEDTFVNGVNHQLLARIELKGDEYINSAQISDDGRMVVAATVAGVKLFQVRKRTVAEEVEVRTRPIDLPTRMRSLGASLVGFTPDNKWLFAVRTTNIIALVKITPGATAKDKPQIHDQVIRLSCKRKVKDRSSSTKLGSYSQAVNCVSFSSDSRVLATGDLSGAIAVWVLEGHEDLQEITEGDKSASDSSDSDSDTDSDSDDDTDSRVIHGQKWIRNPFGSSLPQLDTAILALSFKPHRTVSQSSDSNRGLHATRHNPHPVSHELPPLDTELVAVTASHQVIEFNVMSSKLSDWSRRNPSSHLPQSFTQLKDRVMGIFWNCDLQSKMQRLWLYGPTWLFMLDMSRDLAETNAQEKIGQIGGYDVREPLPESNLAKRISEASVIPPLSKKRKRNTGAGDRKHLRELPTSGKLPNKADAMDIDTGLLSPASDNDDDDDEDIEMETAGTLTQLRRDTHPIEAGNQQDLAEASTSDASEKVDPSQPQPSPSHHTIFRYRSIFGISALQPQTTTTTTSDEEITPVNKASNLEIVLVERPIYDVELIPRFDNGQDWST